MAQPRKPHARTTTERGYGTSHTKLRRAWAKVVARGEAVCWRCGQPIHPLAQWDLGHDDHDRSITRGPEHARRCNRAAAARKTNSIRRAKAAGLMPGTGQAVHNPSRQW